MRLYELSFEALGFTMYVPGFRFAVLGSGFGPSPLFV